MNELSLKLEESEKRAALEENARLVAEGELLMMRNPEQWRPTSLLTDSVYNSDSMVNSRQSCARENFDSSTESF